MSGLRVITIASNKGGVGKTTVATNLAIYLRALREDLPVLLLSLDDQDLLQRMFTLEPSAAPAANLSDAFRARALAPAIRIGQYGVHYIPPSPTLPELEPEPRDPFLLRRLLVASGWSGLVVIDTKGDLGPLTEQALAASDLALVLVADRTSLDQAERIYERLDKWRRPRDRARILLSLVDRRVKYRSGDEADILALLLSEIRRRGHPCFGTFLSRSPKIEALHTNRERRVHSILHGAHGSLVHRQMAQLASDVLELLAAPTEELALPEEPAADRRRHPRLAFPRRIACFCASGPPILALSGRDVCADGIAVERSEAVARAGRVHLALAPEGPGERLLVWASVLRCDDDRTVLRFEVGEDEALGHRLAGFVAGLDEAIRPAAASR